MNTPEQIEWCCMCPRRAGFQADVGYLCSPCFFETQKIMTWLLDRFGWRPMTKQEVLAHEHHINSSR
jgi:hypothetical protein